MPWTCCGASAPNCRHPPRVRAAPVHPHDFRRLLATELVNNGLPIHIGAALLGHIDLDTTHGYIAVFAEDLIRHYRQFLERRRALRPQEEYRPTTDAEWQEFTEHNAPAGAKVHQFFGIQR